MKLHQRAFQLFLLLLLTQLAYHFWPSFSFVNALRIDYLSPTIFFTDVIFVIFISLWLLEKKINIFQPNKYWVMLFMVVLLNIIFSLSSTSSLLHWLRIVQVLLLYLYVLDSKLATNKILTPLAMGIIFSAILSLAQVLTGRNIGGLLYWLGERPLSINQPGVALLSLSGISLLRPYATFPHPNALAGYAGLLFLFTLPYFSKNLIIKLSSLASFLIVVISYSQSAWLALFFSLIVMKKHKFSLHLLFTVFSVFSLLMPLFINVVDLRSFTLPLFISQRLELSQTAGEVIATYPLFGTGLGQFIRTIPAFTSQNIWWLQPVHNLPLLFTAELGLLGLVTLYILTKKYLSTLTINYYPLIIFVLVTAFVDHYWLTAHQNLLLIPILFGTIKTHDLIHK